MSDDFYRALEDRFRASREEIRTRLEGYRPFLQALLSVTPRPKAFDIGCGRGEWLQLLTDEGLEAQGVDLDESMLAACHERGLNAANRDALQTLQAMPDASFDLISAFHVVEHLSFDYLQALLKEAYRTLSPQGLLILETPNSENLIVGTNNFYLDPTHQRPVPAIFLEFLCQHSGFAQSKIVRMQEDPVLHNPETHIGLWQVLYGVSPDYAVVSRKQRAAPDTQDQYEALFARNYGFDLSTLAQRHDQALREHEQARREIEHRSQARLDAHIDDLQQQLVNQREYLENQCAALEQRLNSELKNIYSSRSWRVTQPLREVADKMRHLDRNALKRGLMICAGRAFNAMLRLTARCIPGLSTRIHNLSEVERQLSMTSLSPLKACYSPRVLQLEQRLQQLLETPTGNAVATSSTQKLRLAYVSPMPPERTGIADYSEELLLALSEHYQIDVIVEQTSRVQANDAYQLRDANWLREHVREYEAVLYHMGNSGYHCYMVELMKEVPGIIVLHDFYLSGLIWELEANPAFAGIRHRELYYSHGYSALIDASKDERQAALTYPLNRSLLQKAQGVIVHSQVSQRLATQWYGAQACSEWVKIPLLRRLADQQAPRASARQALGLGAETFVVCSFGLLGETKLNHRLLQAWLDSALASAPDSLLVFVGELGDDAYAQALREQLAACGQAERIRITGWTSGETFQYYLAAADIAVQLRSLSRGETSAAVLDCMNHRLATIVNANGSMADLPEQSVLRLPDEFSDVQLTEALESLWRDPQARLALGERARAVIEQQHSPAHCADLYRQAIDGFCASTKATDQHWQELLQARQPAGEAELLALAHHLAQAQPDPLRPRQLLLDITETVQSDRHSGIERVARALSLCLLKNPPAGVRVEPVYLSNLGGHWHYRYACAYTARLLGLPVILEDCGIDYGAGDQLIALDISGICFIQASQQGVFRHMQAQGVNCQMLIHDLLPVTRPELFPPQAQQHFIEWLGHVAQLDGAVCVSETVVGELSRWLEQQFPGRSKAFSLNHSHHGADLSSSAPSQGLPDNAPAILANLRLRPSILMVGTLEPRKGYLQAIEAFSKLWKDGVDANLVIVGRAGWQQLPVEHQRNIPQLLERLANHPEKDQRLFWLDGISDQFLERVYSSVNGLLAASYDEGFGLPLIESAQKGLPILARDIPVFREVAGQYASYFNAQTPEELAAALEDWLRAGCQPSSAQMPWLTWQQSADNLQHLLLNPTPNAAGTPPFPSRVHA